jgi:hypothetical protein
MATSTKAPSNLHFKDISNDALESYFSLEALKAAQKLVKQGAVQSVEYNPSDKAVYGVLIVNEQEYNLDISESSMKGIVFSSDVEDEKLAEQVVIATLIVYRDTPDYAKYHAAKGSVQSTNADSDKKTTKKTGKKSADAALREQLMMLSTEELTDLVLGYAEKNADVKRDLAVRFQTNSDAVLKELGQDIVKVFPKSDTAYNRFSSADAAKKLKSILDSIVKLPRPLQVQPYWAIAQGVLNLHNYYDFNSKRLDDILENALKEISSINAAQTLASELRQAIVQTMFEYMVKFAKHGDPIDSDITQNFVLSLCVEKADKELLIKNINGIKDRWTFREFQSFLEDLYQSVGDTQGKRALLERNLEYVQDYYDFAMFVKTEEKNIEEAIKIARRGWKDATLGDKTVLLRMMQEYYVGQQNYDELWKIFDHDVRNFHKAPRQVQLITRSGVFLTSIGLGTNTQTARENMLPPEPMQRQLDVFKHEYFQLLLNHAQETSNYGRVRDMIMLAFDYGVWSFKLYLELTKHLRAEDSTVLQAKMIATLEELLKKEATYHWEREGIWAARSVLAEIYLFRNDITKLWLTIRNSLPLLERYQKTFLPERATDYVMFYKKEVDSILGNRSSEAYSKAAKLMRSIKEISLQMLQQKKEWDAYFLSMRDKYRALRNFQKELDKLENN